MTVAELRVAALDEVGVGAQDEILHHLRLGRHRECSC